MPRQRVVVLVSLAVRDAQDDHPRVEHLRVLVRREPCLVRVREGRARARGRRHRIARGGGAARSDDGVRVGRIDRVPVSSARRARARLFCPPDGSARRRAPPMGLPPLLGAPLRLARRVIGFPMRLVNRARGIGGGAADPNRWLVVGLGNPGSKFTRTRHNAGFDAVSLLASAHGMSFTGALKHRSMIATGKIANVPVVLAMPQTFMNLSGEAIRDVLRWYKISPKRMLVLYDDMDSPVGVVKLKGKGGHGGHNGVRNIIDEVTRGEKTFARVKIGIGRPAAGVSVIDHVLRRFTVEEREALERGEVMREAGDAVVAVLTDGLEKAMTRVNNKKPAAKVGEEVGGEDREKAAVAAAAAE